MVASFPKLGAAGLPGFGRPLLAVCRVKRWSSFFPSVVFAIYPLALAAHLPAFLPRSAFSIWKTKLLRKQIRFFDSLTAAISTNHVSLPLLN